VWLEEFQFVSGTESKATSLSGTAKSSRPRGSAAQYKMSSRGQVHVNRAEFQYNRSSPPTPNRPGSQPRRPGMVLHLLMLRPFVQTSD